MTAATLRHARIDALRGAAMVWMTTFHFAFDLNHFGWWRQSFNSDPFWTWQRAAIVSLFLFCAGLGQASAVAHGQGWPRFWRRWAQVAGAAVLVTVGSWFMYPQTFIYFGVLHGIAAMLLVARLTAHWGQWLWAAGLAAFATKFVAAYAISAGVLPDLLNDPSLNWLGLISRKPITEDFVPVLPWLGVLWWGLAAGTWAARHRPLWLAGALPSPLRPLAMLGRFSLVYYLLHQPVLIGALMLLSQLR